MVDRADGQLRQLHLRRRVASFRCSRATQLRSALDRDPRARSAGSFLQLPDGFCRAARASSPMSSPPAPTRRTTRRGRCRTGSAATTSRTTSTSVRATARTRSSTFLLDTKRGLLRAVRRRVRGDGPHVGIPSRVAVGFTPGRPGLRATPTSTGCGASTPTPGPRCTSASTAGCRSSPRRPGAPPSAGEWLGVPPSRQDAGDGTGSLAAPDPNAGDGLGSEGDDVITGDGLPDLGADGDGASAGGTEADDSPLVPEPIQNALKVAGAGGARLRGPGAAGPVGAADVPPAPGARVRPIGSGWRGATRPSAPADAGVSLAPSLTIAETATRLAVALPGSADEARAHGPHDGAHRRTPSWRRPPRRWRAPRPLGHVGGRGRQPPAGVAPAHRSVLRRPAPAPAAAATGWWRRQGPA